MSDSFLNTTVSDFVDVLGKKEPVPGGGGVAALVGALAAGLAQMVASYTVGKKAYADFNDRAEELLVSLDVSAQNLLQDIDGDAQAFAVVSAAYAVPKEDPKRGEAIEHACEIAAQAPKQVYERVYELLPQIEELYTRGSKILRSDAVCAQELALAALHASLVNIYVNAHPYAGSNWAEVLLAFINDAYQELDEYKQNHALLSQFIQTK